MEDLQEAYLAIYEESDVARRAKRAVDHQRAGTHGDDHAIEKESKASTTSVKKATKHKGAKVTPSMPESFDSYDVVLDYLLDEGFADSENNAITMMANMSEEWIDTILDEAAKDQSDKQIEKGVKTTYKAGNVLDNLHQGRSRGIQRIDPRERDAKVKRMRGRLKSRRDDLFGERNKREDEKMSAIKKLLGM